MEGLSAQKEYARFKRAIRHLTGNEKTTLADRLEAISASATQGIEAQRLSALLAFGHIALKVALTLLITQHLLGNSLPIRRGLSIAPGAVEWSAPYVS